jgi:hypothetical protein
MKYTVRLTDDTVGYLDAPDHSRLIGQTWGVSLSDENGMPITKVGAVVEVLDKSDY